jgi:hypothetical protein
MNDIFDNTLITALIGVGGTLLGSILGWMLNDFGRRGVIKIAINRSDLELSPKLRLIKDVNNNTTWRLKFAKKCELEFEADICNSALDQNAINDVRLAFYNKRKVLSKVELYANDDNGQPNNFKYYNMPGRTLKKVIFKAYAEDKSMFADSTNIFIEFKNSKGRMRRVCIDKFDRIDGSPILIHRSRRVGELKALDNEIAEYTLKVIDAIEALDVEITAKDLIIENFTDIREQIIAILREEVDFSYEYKDTIQKNSYPINLFITGNRHVQCKSVERFIEAFDNFSWLLHQWMD